MRGALLETDLRVIAHACDLGQKPGVRLDGTPALLQCLKSCEPLTDFLKAVDLDLAPTRLVAFNKSLAANWSVPWHQDRVIAVRDNVACEGFHHWVPKEGFWHCEPPTEQLETMVFARIHMDAAGDANGAMQIALGSHKRGVVASRDAAEIARTSTIEVCHAQPGDILIAKALLLHRSVSAIGAARRRALRVDYARRSALPAPLEWAVG